MPLSPGQMVHGRYRVISLLSQGGMSAVYEVVDTILNVRCALKEMMPYPGTVETVLSELREQFRQEAQLLADLRHPNLPRVTDHFEEDGNAYLVMDFIRGKRLDEAVSHNGGVTEDEALEWARQLMEAIAHCHEQGVIHRDIKPQNVIITRQGRAVLVDFGLAKLVDPGNPRTRTVMRGLGTPEYAPPEQYDTNDGRTDSRTDIYSIGATLYHALVGEPPPMLAERVVNPTSLVPVRQRREEITRTTEQVVMKSLALQPSQRFQSVAEMYQALFGSPLVLKSHYVVQPEFEMDASTDRSTSTVLLPWIEGARGLGTNRWLRTALVIVGMIVLTGILSLMAGGISQGSFATATATTTATVAPTFTPTNTPTPTATPTVTPTSTSRLTSPTRQPTQAYEDFEPRHFPRPGTPTPTPTPIYIPPTPTPTLLPPTNTPEPGSPSRPQPRPTQSSPTSEPTDPTPAPTPFQRPTLPPP